MTLRATARDTLIAIVAGIAFGLLAIGIYGAAHQQAGWDARCRERGGEPLHARSTSICISRGALVSM